MFVSSDKLHRKCTPQFLRDDQQFIWGPDLKTGLTKINEYYLSIPDNIKDKGVMSFAHDPPKDGQFFVSGLWDFHFPNWRNHKELYLKDKKVEDLEIIDVIKIFTDAPTISLDEIKHDPTEPDNVTIKHRVRKKKGSWYQVNKDIESKNE